MSHFIVAVIHAEDEPLEELLAPYDECLEMEPYIEITRQEAIDYMKKNYPKKYKTDQERLEFMYRGRDVDEDGNILSTANPEARWDWWVVGGRWKNYLRVKGGQVDSAPIKDVDFSLDQKAYEQALRFWSVVVDHEPISEDIEGEYKDFWGPQYYVDTYGTKENYAKQCAQFSTWAVITPDGEWHECGQMGWFGLSSETKETRDDWYDNYYDRFIANIDPELWITIVDCHI